MAIAERQVGAVTVVEISGRITMGAGSQQLDAKIKELVAGGHAALLLDCQGIERIDTQGIQAIVRGFTTLQEKGGKLKLLKLPPRMQEVLRVTRLIEYIESFDDEAEAVKTFAD
jgi:anti-sigma B factor antagonist